MESIIFIVAWIILGIVSLQVMIKEVERMAKKYAKDKFDKDMTDDDVYDEIKMMSKTNGLEMLVILILSIITWPVTVPLVMYGWKKLIFNN